MIRDKLCGSNDMAHMEQGDMAHIIWPRNGSANIGKYPSPISHDPCGTRTFIADFLCCILYETYHMQHIVCWKSKILTIDL